MNFRSYRLDEEDAIQSLFVSVFTNSESESEGQLIGKLVRNLIQDNAEKEVHGFVAEEQLGVILGTVLFSRISVSGTQGVFLLSPVAVHSDHQGRGIGQHLIQYGMNQLKNEGVRFVVTYGDPGFYSKVGFRPISHEVFIPPYELTYPEGWLGLSLTYDLIHSLKGRCSCLSAFNDPAYW